MATDLLIQFSLNDRCVLLLSREELGAMWRRMKDLPVGGGLKVSHEFRGDAAYHKPLAEAGVLEGLEGPVDLLDRERADEVWAAMEGNEVDLRTLLVWDGKDLYLLAFNWWGPKGYAEVRLGTPKELRELLEG